MAKRPEENLEHRRTSDDFSTMKGCRYISSSEIYVSIIYDKSWMIVRRLYFEWFASQCRQTDLRNGGIYSTCAANFLHHQVGGNAVNLQAESCRIHPICECTY
jgi:hypothetical protein